MINEHPPSLNVTESIYNELDELDLVLHLGGISYAKGFGSVVRSASLYYITKYYIGLHFS